MSRASLDLSSSAGTPARAAAPDQTTQLLAWLDRLRAGDETAREGLIEAAAARLRILAHDMLVGDRVRLWEETDDVLQDALVQLHKSLAEVRPSTVRDFLRIAAFHIRRAIVTVARRYFGPHGRGTHRAAHSQATTGVNLAGRAHPIDDSTPSKVAARHEQWLRLHDAVGALPDDLREVTELLWLHGLAQVEIARLLGISDRTVRRRWQRARLLLADALDGEANPNHAYRANGLDAG